MNASRWSPTKTTFNREECDAFTDGKIVIPYEVYRDKDRDTGETFYVTEMLGDLPEGVGLSEGCETHHYAKNGTAKTKKAAVADFAERLSYSEAVPHDCDAEGC